MRSRSVSSWTRGTDSQAQQGTQARAARRRLQPIRGARGRSLEHTAARRAPRVVGLGQFAEGLTGPETTVAAAHVGSRAWLLSALPVVVLVIWVVARVAGTC